MILCDRADIDSFTASGAWGEQTLDGLLRQTAAQYPQHPALLCHDRGNWHTLTYGELDARVDRLARLLLSSGLRQDDVVAIQLPNGIEAYIALLATMRAQGIACPLPLIWRESELLSALAQVNARFIISCGTYAGHAYADMMRFIAAEVFSVRRLLAYGGDLPDGVEDMGELLSVVPDMDLPSPRRDAAHHVATFCFDCSQGAPRPVARSHNEWIAAGRMPAAALRMTLQSRVLSAQFTTSLGGIASALVPWLLSGATLALYDAVDFPLSDQAIADSGADIMLLPYGAAAALAQADRLASATQRIGVVWQAGVLLQTQAPLDALGSETTDIIVFGETALLARRRKPNDAAGELRLGDYRPADAPLDRPALLTLSLDGASDGELQLSGPMLPSAVLGSAESQLLRVGRTGRTPKPTGLSCHVTGGASPKVKLAASDNAVLHVANNAVAASELDKLLCEHSGVNDAAAYAMPHHVMGTCLRVAIVAEPGRRVTIEDLRTFLSVKRLGVHKLPDSVALVDAIPRDANRQVMREQLRKAG